MYIEGAKLNGRATDSKSDGCGFESRRAYFPQGWPTFGSQENVT